MQTEDLKAEAVAVPVKPDDEPDAVLAVIEHRIYVWSSPAPYSVVIQESRSFHRHI